MIEGGMNSGEILKIQLHRPISQPSPLRFAELMSCKGDPGPRIVIEFVFVSRLDTRLIMISHDNRATETADHFQTFSGIGAVTDNVSQADHLLDSLGCDIGKNRFQGLEVAMDIRKNGELHEIHPQELAVTLRDRQSKG
jgi:hypothetical protein